MTRKHTRKLMLLAALPMLAAPSVARADGPYSNCTCRYGGADFRLGQVVCIRGKLAMCGMVANNTSWRFTGQACPVSSLHTPAPARLAMSGAKRAPALCVPISAKAG